MWYVKGRAMVREVGRSIIGEDCFAPQSPAIWDFLGGGTENDTGRGFLPSASVFPRQNHSTNAPFSFVRLTQMAYNLGNVTASLSKAIYARKEVVEDFI